MHSHFNYSLHSDLPWGKHNGLHSMFLEYLLCKREHDLVCCFGFVLRNRFHSMLLRYLLCKTEHDLFRFRFTGADKVAYKNQYSDHWKHITHNHKQTLRDSLGSFERLASATEIIVSNSSFCGKPFAKSLPTRFVDCQKRSSSVTRGEINWLVSHRNSVCVWRRIITAMIATSHDDHGRLTTDMLTSRIDKRTDNGPASA